MNFSFAVRIREYWGEGRNMEDVLSFRVPRHIKDLVDSSIYVPPFNVKLTEDSDIRFSRRHVTSICPFVIVSLLSAS